MTTAIKSAISPFAQPNPEPNANAIRFLDEKLSFVPASGIPVNFRKLSRFFPVIVLVPKSAVEDEETQKKLRPNKSVKDLTDTRNDCLPLDAAKAWLTNSNATNTFEFGAVRGCLSTSDSYEAFEGSPRNREILKPPSAMSNRLACNRQLTHAASIPSDTRRRHPPIAIWSLTLETEIHCGRNMPRRKARSFINTKKTGTRIST